MGLGFNHMYVIDVMIYWWCLRTLETILKIENPNYSFVVTGTSKSEAIKLLEGKFLCYKFFRNSNITKKKMKNYKLKKIWKFFKLYIKMEKTIIKFEQS